MPFVQFEVWCLDDGREELIDTVATLKEAEAIAENEREFCDEVYIVKDADGFDPIEVKRYKGL